MAEYLADQRQGDTWKIKIDYSDDGAISPAPDITGYKFWLTLKSDYADLDADAILQFETTAGNYSGDDPTNGIAYIVIPPATTSAVGSGYYYYDIQSLTPSGEIITLAPPSDRSTYRDKLFVAPQVTKDTA